MEYVNFPIVALGAALICLIGITIYAITQRGSLRSRDEQLVVARAQAYAMLELSQAGVLFLDREHKLMGEASAGGARVVRPHLRRRHGIRAGDLRAGRRQGAPRSGRLPGVAVAGRATAMVDATQNPLARVHSGSRHLAIRFARLVVDGRVHHIIVSIERIAAPRIVPHTIEVPVLNEDTFAKRLAGETGTRPALKSTRRRDRSAAAKPARRQPPRARAPRRRRAAAEPALSWSRRSPVRCRRKSTPAIRRFDITDDSLPDSSPPATRAVLPAIETPALTAVPTPAETRSPTGENFVAVAAAGRAADAAPPRCQRGQPEVAQHLATTITSTETAQAASRPARPRAGSVVRSSIRPMRACPKCSRKSCTSRPARLENFLAEARDKAGQLRAIIKLPAREPQAFREKLVLILELIRGIHARAKRLPLPSVCERAERFEEALSNLRDKQTLSGNDFLPIAVKLDDLLSHLAIQGEVVARLREWRVQNGLSGPPSTEATQRSATTTGTTIRQPQAQAGRAPTATTISGPVSETQKAKRLSDLSQDSLEEMAQFLADMYSKRVSLVCVGLEDVPGNYRRVVEKILGQLIHNAIRHGLETPADRVVQDKPEIGTVAVQFLRIGRRRLPAQRAGRRPRSRSRQDSRRGRAPGRADRGRRRQHRSAQTRQPHLPPRLHHRRRRWRARHRHGRGARAGEQGRRPRRHRHQAGRIHPLPHHAAAREDGDGRRGSLISRPDRVPACRAETGRGAGNRPWCRTTECDSRKKCGIPAAPAPVNPATQW